MPKDPLPATSPGKLPTSDVDIGHVAPSFPDEELWNTLVLRAEYRMSLRLGDFDALFPDEPNTEKGRMARLQAIGLFYWPLDHTKATQAFRGIAATPADPATKKPALDPVMGAWEYFWKKILGDADDSQADQKLKDMLEATDPRQFASPAATPTPRTRPSTTSKKDPASQAGTRS